MIFLKNCFVGTTQDIDVIPIHAEVQFALRDCGLKSGVLMVSIPDSGASPIVFDAQTEKIETLKEAFKQLGPPFVQGVYIGNSVSVPFQGDKLLLAPKRNVYIVDFATEGKRREFVLHLMGEPKEAPAARPTRQQARR